MPKRQAQFDDAVTLLREAVEAGRMRKAEYERVKFTLGNAADAAWNKHVWPFFSAGGWKDQPEAVSSLLSDIRTSSLHDILSSAKKLDRARDLDGPAIMAMRAVMAELLPLAEASAFLKAHLVAGRAPATPRPPANPDKVTGSCSCCFRGIAITGDNRMAHHGYHRPGNGYQTASCPGIRFAPLEQSVAGLVWYRDEMVHQLRRNEELAAQAPGKTVLRWTENMGRDILPKKCECRIGDPDWKWRHAQYVTSRETVVRREQSYLAMVEGELGKWCAHHGIDVPSRPDIRQSDEETIVTSEPEEDSPSL
ncbi:hypothetical protein ACEUZ9_001126 [Paracoccus litorisediminis]|uniref:hypothetical protein n=1 Tax=Paracoccus litorisediminis TaxID=2006130 RepID=UPI0037335BC0